MISYRRVYLSASKCYFFPFWFLPWHALLLQGFFSLLGPLHAFPSFWAAVTIVLVLSCTPFPQDLEHFDHSPQEDCLQSVACNSELLKSFLPPLHMPHVFLQFFVTNSFVSFWPHQDATQWSKLSSHGSTKKVFSIFSDLSIKKALDSSWV